MIVGHRGQFDCGVVRAVGADLAGSFRHQIHWLVMLLSVMILLAVGADYNLLLVSRFKEEIHAGLKTGYIRAMAGTGGVVTAAGLVFAVTMASMLGSRSAHYRAVGFHHRLGLLLDTLIVRSLLMPSIATLLGGGSGGRKSSTPTATATCLRVQQRDRRDGHDQPLPVAR